MFIPRGKHGQLIAIRDIDIGEKINCSHIPTNCLRSSVETRQSWLRGVAGTRCRSDCCTTGFDLRRRVICVRCHPIELRDSLGKSDQSELCFSARNLETNEWMGLKCGSIMTESEAIDMVKEKALVKKIMILNETDVDVSRLFQFTRAAINDAIKNLGKGHFCYQQLLLLESGLALHALCQQVSVVSEVSDSQRRMFVSWVKMLCDIHNYSIETALPFDGMDELVRILIAPETLQTAIKIMSSFKRSRDTETASAFSIFAQFVDQSCECLVFIEGNESVHSTDGLKLRNWWTKKYKAWINAPQEDPITSNDHVAAETEVILQNVSAIDSPPTCALERSFVSKFGIPIALSIAALAGFVLVKHYRK
jgi:hypothetical protein